MSETTCRETPFTAGASARTPKSATSKPFCSLTYLAKSTISNDIRIVNGQNGYTPNVPSVAVTAKVNDECCTPSLPTGASTSVNTNADDSNESAVRSLTANSANNISMADIFGEINEEDTIIAQDKVDASAAVDTRRPWEMKNNYIKHIPPSLMINGHGHGHGHSHLTSLASKMNSLDCWDYTVELECLKGPQDLQLAAELGKTLLERNKELEILLKEHKNTIEEQEQEIVYLKKHTTALREVNDSRLKVYEQLEVGIQDLERANHRLLVENTSDKKHIKTLVHNIEALESRCDELNKQLDETRQALATERRQKERLAQEKNGTGNEAFNVRLRPTDPALSVGRHTERSGESEGFMPDTDAPDCSFTSASSCQMNEANSASSKSINGSGNKYTNAENSRLESGLEGAGTGEDSEEIVKLVNELETMKRAFVAEQQRCTELEEQLVAIIQENQSLQGRIALNSTNEDMKSMQEELSILDEVRQGQMCSRCLRTLDERGTINDEQSSIAPTEDDVEEDDERSLLQLGSQHDDNASEQSQPLYRNSITIQVTQRVPDSLDLSSNAPASTNPYRDLVEKYEALLEVQRSSMIRKGTASAGLSLAEEIKSSGEFNPTQKLSYSSVAASDAENCINPSNGHVLSSRNGSMTHDANATVSHNNEASKNARGRTPTEFSEAETSSSGFSDETSNKYTQTDDRPGYFLCSIGDGEDCKFSIYDDASSIDSRFRNRPEYRELFKEIFAVLKKAAENKEEGEKLPLLDDTHPSGPAGLPSGAAKVPPVTPANEELPIDFGDDTQSIISSAVSEQSFAMSECVTKLERKTAKKHIIEKNQENHPPILGTSIAHISSGTTKQIIENGRVLTPLKREPLEYISVSVGVKKKNRKKNRNFSNDRSESPAALPSPPRFFVSSGKKRKEVRPLVESPLTTPEQINPRRSRAGATQYEWNGSSMVIYNRTANSPHAGKSQIHEFSVNGIEYRPSTVSQDLHKLKKLDLSYAEVLRRADACKHQHRDHRHHNQNQHHQQMPQQQQRRRHQH